MVTDDGIDFRAYLQCLCKDDTYRCWEDFYTPINVLEHQRTKPKKLSRRLDVRLIVQTIQPLQSERPTQEQEKIERLDALEGLRKYATNHVLLKGRPGSGKSTVLECLLLEEAKKAKTDSQAKIPILVQLRRYKSSVLGVIKDFLIEHQLSPELLKDTQIENLLFAGHFLLLISGLNELPNDQARRDLYTFRQKYRRVTPMIFTTRDLGVDLDIEIKLEMKPLTQRQMQQFVRGYLPENGEEMLRQLGGRLQELGETPLFLSMLCEVFNDTKEIPTSLGLLFRGFSAAYDKLKQDVPISEGLRNWQSELLQHLAFVMMQGDSSTELRLSIPKRQAWRVLTDFLQDKVAHPDDCARRWLEDLLKYHLIQLRTDEQIEFRHQLLQEYYAGERLLQLLPRISDHNLKRDYLNYLKWTEPLALMLALVDKEVQAMRVVKLALEVDFQLAGRLGGEVKDEFQTQTVDLVAKQKVPEGLTMWLLGTTRSNHAIPFLSKALENKNESIRWFATKALDKIARDTTISALNIALQDNNDFIRRAAFNALEKIGTEAIISSLQQALKDENVLICEQAIYVLGDIAGEAAIPDLITALAREDVGIRNSVLCVLAQLCGKEQIPELIQELADRGCDVESDTFCTIRSWLGILFVPRRKILEARLTYSPPHSYFLERIQNEVNITTLHQNLSDQDSSVRETAVYMLGQIGNEEAINVLFQAVVSEHWRVRLGAVHWLAQIANKTSNKIIFNNIIQCLYDTNSDVAGYAGYVLEQKGIPELLTNLSKLLSSRETHIYTLIQVVLAIQLRCRYYNHTIAISIPHEEENLSDPLLDKINKIMSEKPKVQMNFNAPITITGSSIAGSVEGDSIGTQNNSPSTENIAEVEKVLQQLLEQIEQTKPTPIEAQRIVDQAVEKHPILKDGQIVEQAIKRYPPLNVRLRRVVTAAGIETVKVLFAPAGILTEAIEAWIQPE